MIYTIRVSKRKGKKYDAILENGKIVSFGHIKHDGTPFMQYRDSTHLKAFKDYDHHDKKRQEQYFEHHKNKISYSPVWFAANYLWS